MYDPYLAHIMGDETQESGDPLSKSMLESKGKVFMGMLDQFEDMLQ